MGSVVHKEFWGYGRVIGLYCKTVLSSWRIQHSRTWKRVNCKRCLAKRTQEDKSGG